MEIRSKNDVYAWVLATLVAEYYQLRDEIEPDLYWIMQELTIRCAPENNPEFGIEDFIRATWVGVNYIDRWVANISGNNVLPEAKEASLMANIGWFKRFVKDYYRFNSEWSPITSPHDSELQRFLELRKQSFQEDE